MQIQTDADGRLFIEVNVYVCDQPRGKRRIYEGGMTFALLSLDAGGMVAATQRLKDDLERHGCQGR